MTEIKAIEMNQLQDSTELYITLTDGKEHYFTVSTTAQGLFINKNDKETKWEIHQNGLMKNF